MLSFSFLIKKPIRHRLLWVLYTLCFTGYTQADIAIIVNPSLEINNIRASQVRNAFLGKVSIEINDQLLVPVDLRSPQESRDAFYELVAHKDSVQMNTYWSSVLFTGARKKPIEVEDVDSLKTKIAENKTFIGYIDTKQLDNSVKVLLIFNDR